MAEKEEFGHILEWIKWAISMVRLKQFHILCIYALYYCAKHNACMHF